MRLIRNVMFACLFGSVVLGGCMSDSQAQDDRPVGSASYIKSTADLEAHLQTAINSPLDRLSPAARQRFISSMTFTEAGLASWENSDLNALPSTDAAQILALFRPAPAAGVVAPRGTMPSFECRPLQGGCVHHLNFDCDPSTCFVALTGDASK